MQHRRSVPGRPAWWPEGETWPPSRRRAVALHRFRRRALVAAVVLFAFAAVIGTVTGKAVDDRRRRDPDGPPFGLLVALAVSTAIAGAATRRAYRRLAEPAGELVDAADRVGGGDYDVLVRPRGPRELRDLMGRFNEMTERLREAEQQRRRMLADVTHELRTPLMVLQSRIEAQLDGVHPRDDAHLEALLESTRTLGVLVDDLHTLALAEAGRLPLHRETVDAASLAADVVDAARSSAPGTGIRLSVADGLPALDVDPTRIRQVLANLLANALRHSPPGSEVHVQVGARDGGVEFAVADEGPGIPEDQLEVIFEPFARAADTGGSGLGLAISRDIVHAHGGSIRASNGAQGAVVTFVLPAAAPPPTI